ncbi:CREB homolog crh-1 [Caenorhabditis elegans]|uniref:CREB homolog crh-1 n=1 Tax=Caenorhabditis elegans TaxID=6239 RepID=CREBH_CAEEL|nr:CREB homolog crh-1 [Caenorhabditis elegans]CAB54382.2 CREB homolog crh-1 [Caenorhabditis elegans]|eukprot:NP_001022860.1 CREB Homolog [Caenorhabditis elegans]
MATMASTSNCSPVATSPLMMLLFKALQEGGDSEDEARRRREQLNRRPSYRMILKDLETADKVMKKEPEETPPSSVDASPLQFQSVMRPPPTAPPTSAATPNRILPSSNAASPYGSPLGSSILSNQPLVLPFAPINGDFDFSAAIAAASQPKVFPGGPQQNGLGGGGGGGGVPGPSSGIAGMSVQPPTSSTPSQQQSVQSLEGTSGLIGSAMKPMLGIDAVSFPEFGTTDWQSPMLSGGYSSSPSPTMTGGSMRMGGGPLHGEDESNRKRQVRLLKNREAAKECRRKKKEYVKCLENRVSVLENQNKALIEELKTLKELYCRKEKDGM